MIPGDNLLEDALSLIDTTPFQLEKYNGSTENDIGIDVPTYDAAVDVDGSVQAVPRTAYKSLGLDLKRNYITIYTSEDITGVERDSSGDRILFNNNTFQVLDENDWRPIDGWSGIMCVEIQP